MIENENDFDKDKGILNILDLENRIWFFFMSNVIIKFIN
jgi:hypothetical protein